MRNLLARRRRANEITHPFLRARTHGGPACVTVTQAGRLSGCRGERNKQTGGEARGVGGRVPGGAGQWQGARGGRGGGVGGGQKAVLVSPPPLHAATLAARSSRIISTYRSKQMSASCGPGEASGWYCRAPRRGGGGGVEEGRLVSRWVNRRAGAWGEKEGRAASPSKHEGCPARRSRAAGLPSLPHTGVAGPLGVPTDLDGHGLLGGAHQASAGAVVEVDVAHLRRARA